MRIIYSFHTIRKFIVLIVIWTVLVLVHALIFDPLIPLSFSLLIIDSVVFSLLIVAVSLLYRLLIRKEYYALTIQPQTLFNYITLGVFVIVVWVGSNLLLLSLILSKDEFILFIPIIPIRFCICALIYACWAINDNLLPNKEDAHDAVDSNDDFALSSNEVLSPKVEVELIERVAVKLGQKIHVIMIPEILYLQSDGDYVMIYTMNGKFIKEQTMKYFEEHLPTEQFVRIHRSYIVNIEMISRIELYKKQQQMLTLKNGHQLKTSIAGYKILKSKLGL